MPVIRKKVFFMRHGRALMSTDYERMNYDEFMRFMRFMRRMEDPSLSLEKKEIETNAIIINREQIDIIFPSSRRRAQESAEFIKTILPNSPKVNYKLAELIDEVEFSEAILSEKEFNDKGGLRGCRGLIIERWLHGEGAEPFQRTIDRINKLRQYLLESGFRNILVITHGFILRLIHLFYSNRIVLYYEDRGKFLECLLEAPIVNYGEGLEISLEHPERFCHPFDDIVVNDITESIK